MQEKWRRPRAGKRRRNLSADQSGFPHARDSDAALAGKEHVHGLGEAVIQACLYLLQCTRFDLEYPASCLQTHRNLRIIATLSQLGRSSAAPLRPAAAAKFPTTGTPSQGSSNRPRCMDWRSMLRHYNG